jgi:hypothetical protein
MGFKRLFVFGKVVIRGVVSRVIVIASAIAVIIRVFILFALQGFRTRDSRSLIAFKD